MPTYVPVFIVRHARIPATLAEGFARNIFPTQTTSSANTTIKIEGLRQMAERRLSEKAKGDLFVGRTTAIVRIAHSGREVPLI